MIVFREHPVWTDYIVSNEGDIWSKPRIKAFGRTKKKYGGAFLKHHVERYKTRVMICGRGNVSVGRMVAETFIGPCPSGMEVCHNDGDPNNNKVSNLRWDTHFENIQDAVRQGRMKGGRCPKGERQWNSKLTDGMVHQIRIEAELGERYADIADRFGVGPSCIGKIVRGENWAHI